MRTVLHSPAARPYTRVSRQEMTRQRELTHLQVNTELGVGRGARYACVSEHALCAGRHSARHLTRVRIPSTV